MDPESPRSAKQQTAGDIADMSPSIGKFLDRSTIPYWSPATQAPVDDGIASIGPGDQIPMASYDITDADDGNSTLVASAREFVPNFGEKSIPQGAGSGTREFQQYEGKEAEAAFNNEDQENIAEMELQLEMEQLRLQEEQSAELTGWYPTGLGLTVSSAAQTTRNPNNLMASSISDRIRGHFHSAHVESMRQMKAGDPRYKEIPARYHCAYPLGGADAGGHGTDAGGIGPRDFTDGGTGAGVEMGTGTGSGAGSGAGGISSSSRSFGFPCSVYKVVDSKDSRNYVLRRFDNIKTSVPVIQQVMQQWSGLKSHPGVVPLCHINYDKQNPSAIFFLHEYFPLAKTLNEYYITGSHATVAGSGGGATAGGAQGLNPNSAAFGSAARAIGLSGGKGGQPYVQEEVLWNLLVQLVVSMRSVHMEHNGAVRAVDTNHILVTSLPSSSRTYAQAQAQGNSAASTPSTCPRVRFNCVGVLDVLEHESRKSVQDLQREDVFKLGQVLLSVGLKINSASISKSMMLEQHLPYFQRVFSAQLGQLVGSLLNQEICHIDALSANPLLLPYLYNEISNSHAHTESLYNCLSREYENGRLLRILIKLGVLNERPSATGGQLDDWSETGDRYVLKLFRDYVFHQCYPEPGSKDSPDGTSSGVPCVDMGHIISSLHKLDVNSRDISEYEAEEANGNGNGAGSTLNNGVNETILLTARNNKDMVVVGYKDVAR